MGSSKVVQYYMKSVFVLAAAALSSLVQDDGTVRDSAGTLCASNDLNQLRMRDCDPSDASQVFDKAHFEATGQIKNVVDLTCWWVPSIGDMNNKNTNQRVWLIRCDTSSGRLDPNQMIWSVNEEAQIKNAYTDSVTASHCLAFRNNGYPLKMKPCTHRKTFFAEVAGGN